MKTAVFIAAITALGSQVNALAIRAPQSDDNEVSGYALNLENLENAFYGDALGKFDEQAFADAGFPPFVRKRFEQIASQEATHVSFLAAALGDKAPQPCTYKFPFTDPRSFAALSGVLENVGVAAYTGAAQQITDKGLLTAVASILATEARHVSWIDSAVNKGSGWNGPFETPLTQSQVNTLAFEFIESCPSTNPPLPAPFPALTLTGTISPGSTVSVEYNATEASSTTPVSVAFLSGPSQTLVPIDNGKVTIPWDLEGVVFAIVTTGDKSVTDNNTVAGPTILEFAFPSSSQ